jgi:delta 1-pyrroline-5-carboxylate dehydrogenase
MHIEDQALRAFAAYCQESVDLHRSDADAALASGDAGQVREVLEDMYRYQRALLIVEEYREYLCRLSEVADRVPLVESVTAAAGGSHELGTVGLSGRYGDNSPRPLRG